MIKVRRVTRDDCRMMWKWANDSIVRSMSFHPSQISWPDHVAWFDSHVDSPTCAIFIIEDDRERPVGQVRFDIGDRNAELTISVERDARGRGIGTEALRETCRIFRDQYEAPIVAHVRPENEESVRAFEKAGFGRRGIETVNGYPAIRFELLYDAQSSR